MPPGTRPAPPDDTVRLITQGAAQTHKWVSVMWLKLTASTRTQADLSAILVTIEAAWGTRYVTQVPNSVTKTLMTAIWITPGGGEIVATNGTTRTGSNGETLVGDASAALVISWHLNAYYRGGHPRTYFPGATTANITNGSAVSGSKQTSLQTASLGYLNDINAVSSGGITACQLGTVSFATGNAWRTPPIFRPFVGVSISPVLGSQRRRIRG